MKKTRIIAVIASFALALFPLWALAQSSLGAGGTGWSTSSVGDLIVGTSSTIRYSRLPIGTSGFVLQSSSTSPFKIEWVATSTLGFSTGSGTNYWAIGNGTLYNSTSTDNVGIGTAAPVSTLNVFSSTTAEQVRVSFSPTQYLSTSVASNGNATFQPTGSLFMRAGGGSSLGLGVASTNYFTLTTALGAFPAVNVSVGTTSSVTRLFVQGAAGTNPFAVASSTGIQMLTLTQGGNLGIGTTTPSSSLTVAGDASIQSNLFLGSNVLAPQLNAFGSGYHQFFMATSSNDITGADFWNTSSGPLAGSILSFNNASTTRGNIGFSRRYLASIVASGPNFQGALVGANSLTPNSVALFTNDGNTIIGAATTSPVGTTAIGNIDLYTGGDTFYSGLPDFRLNNLGNATIGLGTTTAVARLHIKGTSTMPVFSAVTGAGVDALFIKQAGEVGIGTSTPSSPLHVIGRITDTMNGAGLNAALRTDLGRTNTAGDGVMWENYTNTQVTPDFFGKQGFKFEGGTLDANKQYQVYAADSSAPKFVVAGNGNIGIGTSTPLASLDIKGTAGFMSIRVSSSTGVSLFEIEQNGNIGIGSTTPSCLFSVQVSANVYSCMRGSEITQVSSNASTPVMRIQGNGTADLLQVQDGILPALYVRDGGNVGIGTSTPDARLKVIGSGNATSSVLSVATSTGTSVFSINGSGHVTTGGGTPAVSSCGTSPSISGNDTSGTVTTGTGVVTSCTITFAIPRSNANPKVLVNTNGGLNVAGGTSAKSGTAVTFSFSGTIAGGSFDYLIVD